jgi:hypothetical protein
VYTKFIEGLATPDLRAARSLRDRKSLSAEDNEPRETELDPLTSQFGP